MHDLKTFPCVLSMPLVYPAHGNGDAIQRQGGDGRGSRLYPAVHCPEHRRQPLDAFQEALSGPGAGCSKTGLFGTWCVGG